MANCAIFQKGSNEITYFILNCKQENRNFVGSNMKVSGIKEYIFDTKWTEDIANPIYNEKKEIIGYDKKVSELTEALRFNEVVVSNRKDVDDVTVNRIREKYSINEENKCLRLGKATKEWKVYNEYVTNVVNEGREFKDKHYPIKEG